MNIARSDGAGMGLAVVGHAALIAAIYFLYDKVEPVPPEPVPMEVSFVEEVGPVSSAPEVAEAPAPMETSVEPLPADEPSGAEASVPEPIRPPVPEPVRPPVERSERARPDLTRSPVVRPAQPPRVTETRPQPRPQSRPPQARPQPAQPRPGPQRPRPAAPGPSFADVARGIGRAPTPSPGRSPAPAQRSAAATGQERASFTAALTRQINRCSRQQRPSTQEARSLRPVVVIRLRPDGSLDGAPQVRSVEGLNDTNRQYETQAREAIIRAIRNCAPYTGLPEELYAVPNGWRQPTIRMSFQ